MNNSKVTNNETKESLLNFLKYLAYILLAFAIPAIVVVFTCIAQSKGYQIECSESILAFIGILATFVVISNQVQIRSIESRIDRIEDKVNRNNEGIIDAKLNNSRNVEYMRRAADLVLKDNYQLEIVLKDLSSKYGERDYIQKRLKKFAAGGFESRDFIFALADALNLGKDDYPNVEN